MHFLKYILLSSVLFFAVFIAHAQDNMGDGAEVYKTRAHQLLEQYKYYDAADQFKKAIKLDRNDTALVYRLVDCQWKLKTYSDALETLQGVVADGSDPNISTRYIRLMGELLRINEKYSEAMVWFRKYNDLVHGDAFVERQMYSLSNIQYYYRDTAKYQIHLSTVDGPAADFSPCLFQDELAFVSRKKSHSNDPGHQKMYELYSAQVKDSTLGRRHVLISSMKTHRHIGPTIFYDGGSKCISTQTLHYPKDHDNPDNNKNKLFEGTKQGKDWVFTPLDLVPKGYSAAHPALSSDSRVLYFVSDIPGGFGGKDLYKSKWEAGHWSPAENLGAEINTERNEMFPTLFQDSTLYFSSDGHPGLGGLDLFVCKLFGSDNELVVNMGKPINSSGDDFGLIYLEPNKVGYFSSNRSGGKGSDDLYRFDLVETRKIVLEGFAKDRARNMTRLEGMVMYDNITNELICESDNTGHFVAELDNKREYQLGAEVSNKPGTIRIHFEGFLKDVKDTSNVIDFTVYDTRLHREVNHSEEEGYFAANLEEGREYQIRARLPKGKAYNLADIRVEGFVMQDKKEHYNLREVHILNSHTGDMLFKSDNSGFFSFHMGDGVPYSVRTYRKEPNERVEIVFEGFVKSSSDTKHPINLTVFDSEGHKEVAHSTDDGYIRVVLNKEHDYDFEVDLLDGTEVDLEDIRLEGFAKDVKVPSLVGEVKLRDKETGSTLFKSDKNGFFSFKLNPKKKYHLHATPWVPGRQMLIWMEGRVKSPDDSTMKLNLEVVDAQNGEILFQGNDGLFSFEMMENTPYNFKADITDVPIVDTVDVTVADLVKFEGFALNAKKKTRARNIIVFDAETEEMLFKTDEIGFYSFELDPNRRYKIVAKNEDRVNHGGDHLLLRFKGFVRDQNDSMTVAKLLVTDPSSKEKIASTKMEGTYSFVLEENKVYDFIVTPIPIKKEVLDNVNLIMVSSGEVTKQFILEEKKEGKLYEVRFVQSKSVYTDGVVVREFTQPFPQNAKNEASVKEFLKQENVLVQESTMLRSIQYDYNKTTLSKEGTKQLKVLVDLMNRYPSLTLVISSFADARGTAEYNKNLTDKRNESVLEFIRNSGINASRIKAVSYGNLKALGCQDCSEDDHQQNRRTDFHVISF